MSIQKKSAKCNILPFIQLDKSFILFIAYETILFCPNVQLTSEESWVFFDQDAKLIHNKVKSHDLCTLFGAVVITNQLLQVRALAGWPGTRASVQVFDTNGQPNVLEIKLITTRVCSACDKEAEGNEILFSSSKLLIPCAGQSWLEVFNISNIFELARPLFNEAFFLIFLLPWF